MEQTDEKNIAILCNDLAGAGAAVPIAKEIADALLVANIHHRLFSENWPNQFDGFSDIFIVGGDGTLNYFINHYPGIHLPLVLFKGGTGNDFHWLLYGDETLEEQLQIALSAKPKPIDVGKCNERYFINGLGIGFEGAVAKDLSGKKKRPGKTSFFISILKIYLPFVLNITGLNLQKEVFTEKCFWWISTMVVEPAEAFTLLRKQAPMMVCWMSSSPMLCTHSSACFIFR